ncbi:hypothetical protein PF008_g20879 [Phytophthora fragariae]|uniref:Uncharacterized protein n=1 Tax=Phytophthora fragariae TaxID=53985 RepID=A0A6G0QY87_9STRA|nr:hypothetical protein PF008_g20879 [Phytophthora fragariae]
MARGGKRGPDDNESSTRKRRRTADPPPANNATGIGVNSVLGNSADVAQIAGAADHGDVSNGAGGVGDGGLVMSDLESFVAYLGLLITVVPLLAVVMAELE